jgi:hypothetical protein
MTSRFMWHLPGCWSLPPRHLKWRSIHKMCTPFLLLIILLTICFQLKFRALIILKSQQFLTFVCPKDGSASIEGTMRNVSLESSLGSADDCVHPPSSPTYDETTEAIEPSSLEDCAAVKVSKIFLFVCAQQIMDFQSSRSYWIVVQTLLSQDKLIDIFRCWLSMILGSPEEWQRTNSGE